MRLIFKNLDKIGRRIGQIVKDCDCTRGQEYHRHINGHTINLNSVKFSEKINK